jgi:ribosomal-protein-alanine N-acetyltransferase
MSIVLTPAAQVHAALLSGMHGICFAEPWSPDSMSGILDMPGTVGLIAVDGDSLAPALRPPGPAGYVLWRVMADEAEILSVAVLPPWRRTGLGRRLMAAALEQARAAAATVMFLEVAIDNDAAQALYRGLGFVGAGIRKKYYADLDALVMRCELAIS